MVTALAKMFPFLLMLIQLLQWASAGPLVKFDPVDKGKVSIFNVVVTKPDDKSFKPENKIAFEHTWLKADVEILKDEGGKKFVGNWRGMLKVQDTDDETHLEMVLAGKAGKRQLSEHDFEVLLGKAGQEITFSVTDATMGQRNGRFMIAKPSILKANNVVPDDESPNKGYNEEIRPRKKKGAFSIKKQDNMAVLGQQPDKPVKPPLRPQKDKKKGKMIGKAMYVDDGDYYGYASGFYDENDIGPLCMQLRGFASFLSIHFHCNC